MRPDASVFAARSTPLDSGNVPSKLQMVFLIFLKSGDVKSDRRKTGRENGERNGGIDSQDRTLPVDVLFIARVG